MDDNEFLSIIAAIVGGLITILIISIFVSSARQDARQKNYELEKMRIEYEYLGEPMEVNNEV